MNDRDGGQILVKKRYVITGERINGAEPAFDGQATSRSCVSTDGQGARVLQKSPAKTGNRMAIVLIEKGKPEVITAPVIQGELGSNFQISGRGRRAGNSDIVLSDPLRLDRGADGNHRRAHVGPSLGAENIERSFNSVMWGFVALAAFICVYYMVMG